VSWPKRRTSGAGGGRGQGQRTGRGAAQAVGQGAQGAQLAFLDQGLLGVGALQLGLLDDQPLDLALAVGDHAFGGEQFGGGGGGLAAQGSDRRSLAGIGVGALLQVRGHGADQDGGPHRVAGVVLG
jgi:hypothetical protein